MARGWRLWGRVETAEVVAAAKEVAVSDRPRALSTAEELVRRADWDSLSDERRTALLAPYPELSPPASDAVAAPPSPSAHASVSTSPQFQAWVAGLVEPWLQHAAVSVVRTWLADAAPDAHLYVAGHPGHGRTSVVVTLAHQAMAQHTLPPDYCYVPDPDALARSLFLTLPAGTAVPFVDVLAPALHYIASDWHEYHSSSADDSEAHSKAAPLDRYFDSVKAVAPAAAHPYLERLHAAITAQIDAPFPPSFCDVDAPAGRVRQISALANGQALDEKLTGDEYPPTAAQGAPVIVTARTFPDIARAVLRANGGVLILTADELLDREHVSSLWPALRTVLRSGTIAVRGPGATPVPVSLRVVVMGTEQQHYELLKRADDFARLFRYKAVFDTDAPWTREGEDAYKGEAAYAALAAGIARHYQLPPLDSTGVARLVEEGARRAPARHRARLSTDLVMLRDLVVEAGHTAQAAASDVATREHIEAVITSRRKQQGQLARWMREAVVSEREIVPTIGAEIGQINGLSVYLLLPAERRFAVPFRLSVSVSPGRERLIDIAREAGAADDTHISGALTMAGFLARRYGSQRPISVVARIRFEQDHGSVSGDSASAAELFALLSALADVPIYRSLAVTGAVGQYGEIQPIGAVNDKVEGFWEICRIRRAAGEQPEGPYGVLIPAANEGDLMLRREVVESIAGEAWFHIWPISTVDEGLTLLTGVPAAEIHARVDGRLQRFHEAALRANAPQGW